MIDPSALDRTRTALARSQKRGLHFIMASVIIWVAVAIVHLTALPIETKNLLTFVCTCPLMPLAWGLSRMLNIPFSNKENALAPLGMVISCAQLPYLLIAMWVFAAMPEKMVMALAMIFGAHLLPFGWLYKSRVYYAMTGIVAVGALVVGLLYPPHVLAIAMAATETAFCLLLTAENKTLPPQ